MVSVTGAGIQGIGKVTEAGVLNQEGVWQEQGVAGAGLSADVTKS